MKRLRIYLDTSVFGGCFDDEFRTASKKLFTDISAGKFILVISATLLEELQGAPEKVRNILKEIPDKYLESIELSDEIEKLRDAHLKMGIVGEGSQRDAEHIAAASVAKVDLIISWNFKHIVHYDKIKAYHAVNLLEGYPPIPIHSPTEVIYI